MEGIEGRIYALDNRLHLFKRNFYFYCMLSNILKIVFIALLQYSYIINITFSCLSSASDGNFSFHVSILLKKQTVTGSYFH